MFRTLVSSFFALPEWVFGRRAAGLDIGFGLLAAGWFALMIWRPDIFDRGAFVGLGWLPDRVWILFLAILVGGHAVGLLQPSAKGVRVAASLISAWMWILVAVSLGRVDIGPGVVAYGLYGVCALLGALYVAGLPRWTS